MSHWFRTAFVLVVAGLVFPPGSAAAQPSDVVAFALVPITVDAVPYYAQDLGYFRAVGIDAHITTMANGPAVVAGVVSGSIDIGFSNALSLAAAHEKGLPVKILFGTEIAGQKPTNGILTVRRDSNIRTGRDLNGKTVAVSGFNSTNMYAVENWIDHNGGDSKTVKFVEIPAPSMADTLAATRVDAASMDAVNLISHEQDFRVLAPTYASVAPKFIGGCYFATAGWIAAHRELAARVVEALRRAATYANAHTADAEQLYAQHSRFPLAEIQKTPFPTYSVAPVPEMYQPLIDLAARYGLLKATFPATDLVSSVASTDDVGTARP